MTVDNSARYKGLISNDPNEMDFYVGPAAKRWDTNAVSAGTNLRWDKGSKNDRAAESIYHSGELAKLVDFAKSSGLGEYKQSATSVPGWTPEQNRDTSQRLAENIWRESSITDLENWAATIAPIHGLEFTASDKYDLPSLTQAGSDLDDEAFENAIQDATRTGELYKQSQATDAGIKNLQSFLGDFEGARQKNYDKNIGISREDQYGAYIDQQYENLLGRTDGADAAGKKFWTDQLLSGDAGLEAGASWKGYIDRALKGSEEYKDLQVSTGAELEPVLDEKTIAELMADAVGSIQFPTYSPPPMPDYSSLFAEQDAAWNKKFDNLAGTYQSQMDDLKSVFEESTRSQEALLQGYRDQQAAYKESQQAQAAYGERPMNQSVKGVKTANELPGFQPKFRGTRGHFNRTGSRLTTGALNI